MTKLDLTKPLRIVGTHQEVKIFTSDMPGEFRHAISMDQPTWFHNDFMTDAGVLHDLAAQVENIPESTEMWAAVYLNCIGNGNQSLITAQNIAGTDCLGFIKITAIGDDFEVEKVTDDE